MWFFFFNLHGIPSPWGQSRILQGTQTYKLRRDPNSTANSHLPFRATTVPTRVRGLGGCLHMHMSAWRGCEWAPGGPPGLPLAITPHLYSHHHVHDAGGGFLPNLGCHIDAQGQRAALDCLVPSPATNPEPPFPRVISPRGTNEVPPREGRPPPLPLKHPPTLGDIQREDTGMVPAAPAGLACVNPSANIYGTFLSRCP